MKGIDYDSLQDEVITWLVLQYTELVRTGIWPEQSRWRILDFTQQWTDNDNKYIIKKLVNNNSNRKNNN